MVVTLLERLDMQGVGMSGPDTVDEQDPTRRDAVFVSVISAPVR